MVMEIPIKGFLMPSFIDWPGEVCAVVFLPLCNLRCGYCHNHDLVVNANSIPSISLDLILRELDSYRSWVDGVVITGGEPTVHADLPELCRCFRNQGFRVKLDTNGLLPHILKPLIEHKLVDAVAMDIKTCLDPVEYEKVSGVPVNLDLIRMSIEVICESPIWKQFRTTIVPGLHTLDHVRILAEQLKPFHSSLTLQNFKPRDDLPPEYRNREPFPDNLVAQWQHQADMVLKPVA